MAYQIPQATKISQALKVSWMVHWRMVILFPILTIFIKPLDNKLIYGLVLLLTWTAGPIMVYGLGKTIRIFPLIRLMRSDEAIIDLYELLKLPPQVSQPQSPDPYQSKTNPYENTHGAYSGSPSGDTAGSDRSRRNYQRDRSKPRRTMGTITGFEPDTLESVTLDLSAYRSFGTPGSGLSQAGFSQRATEAGQLGEVNFAKVLQMTDLHEKFATYWSLHRTDDQFNVGSVADIDCVLVANDTIYLIDLKMYTQGDVIYRQQGREIYCVDRATGRIVGAKKKMTSNMKIAVDNFKHSGIFKLMNWKVKTAVVFMPTKYGMGEMIGLKWPGDIPVYSLPDFLKVLEIEKGRPWLREWYDDLHENLMKLVKN